MRSKALFVSNILATVYAAMLLYVFGGAIVSAGGLEYIEAWQQYFDLLFELVGFSSVSVNVLYALVILLILHVGTFTLGFLLGWIGYIAKKSGLAKLAAVLYLIGTICFPICVFFGLPITIIGFVGAGKQKKINTLNS